MADFEVYVDDDRYKVPSLYLISATSEARARAIVDELWRNSDHHQGVELRQLPGLPAPTHAPPLAANATFTGNDAPQQVLLTRKGTDALVRLERLLDDANHALAAQLPAGTQGALDDDKTRSSAVATATDRAAAGTRGD